MGKVIDLDPYRQKAQTKRNAAPPPRDGLYLKAAPPFIIFKHYQNGVIRRAGRLLSEYLFREIMDNLP
jgi:hypothetical protein